MRITTTTQKNAMNPGGLVEPGSPTQSFKDDNTNTHHTHHKSSTNVNSTPKKQQQQQPTTAWNPRCVQIGTASMSQSGI